jgi:predicted ribosome quality control (RQC) complex YloA/Tae2 family protein
VSPPQAVPQELELLPEVLPEEPFDAEAHAQKSRELLFSQVEDAVRRRLRDTIKARERKAQRLASSLQEEAAEAKEDAETRELADLLAANLSRVAPGRAEVEILDFSGAKRTIQLDPALPPAVNLDRLYRRAAKAERKTLQVAARLEEVARELDLARALQSEFAELKKLAELLEFAEKLGIDLRPSAPGEHRGDRGRKRVRLPYRIFVLPSGREVWIGKSAADNDELSFKRAAKSDLWLHAGGVEGSHVILRCGDGSASKAEIEAAAQLAALFSKAKGSTTVPVWLTEKRYLRKPRKAPAGVAAPQRTRTLFVAPVQPEGHWLTRESGG